MGNIYDCIVIGLGPAGATASYELKRGGLRVLALDKESFPRYKPCGGCLSKKIDELLDFDFKEVVEHTIRGAVFTHAFKRELSIVSNRPVGYMVKRERFDSLLVDRARGIGVEIREGECVKTVKKEGDWIDVNTAKGSYRCRYLIGADGPFSIVAKRFFPEAKRSLGVAMEGEAKATPDLLKRFKGVVGIDFGYIPHGYGWVFPKEGILSIGIAGLKEGLGDVKGYFNGFLQGKGLDEVEFLKLKGWVIPAFYDENALVVKDRVALIGDAGGMVDPFLGEGIYYAIKSAKVVSREVLRHWEGDCNHEAVQRAVSNELYEDFKAAKRVANLVYGFPELWYDILEKNPSLMEDYYGVLRGEKNYGDFLKDIRQKMKESYRVWLKILFSIATLKLRRLFKKVLL